MGVPRTKTANVFLIELVETRDRGTYQHPIKPRLSIHCPFRQPVFTFLVSERIRYVAVVREKARPFVYRAVIGHADIQRVPILIEQICYLLMLVQVFHSGFQG